MMHELLDRLATDLSVQRGWHDASLLTTFTGCHPCIRYAWVSWQRNREADALRVLSAWHGLCQFPSELVDFICHLVWVFVKQGTRSQDSLTSRFCRLSCEKCNRCVAVCTTRSPDNPYAPILPPF